MKTEVEQTICGYKIINKYPDISEEENQRRIEEIVIKLYNFFYEVRSKEHT